MGVWRRASQARQDRGGSALSTRLRGSVHHLVRDALVGLREGGALPLPPRLAPKGADHHQQLLPRHLATQEEDEALGRGEGGGGGESQNRRVRRWWW